MKHRKACPVCDNTARRFYAAPRDGETFYQCQVCGMIYQTLVASHQEQRLWYNHEHRPSEAVEEQNRRYAHLFLEPQAKGVRLLEIGSNTGAMLDEYRSMGFEVLGVEPSEELAAVRPDLPVIIGFFETAPELDGRLFDVVISFHVLEHVESPVRFAKKVRRHLRQSGLWLNYMPNVETWKPANLQTWEKGQPWIHVETKHLHEHINLFSKDTAFLLCCRAGFGVFRPGFRGDDLLFYAGVA